MLKIWGRISSINVRKVVFTAQLLHLPFEHIDAGAAFGITKTPEYLERNPNALVPTLEDGDFVLWESNVIVRYLCAKHAAGGLYPEDLRTRFDAERWRDWQQTTLNGAGRDALIQFVRTPAEKRNAGDRGFHRRDRAASHAARRPSRAAALHGRRAPDDGRHPGKILPGKSLPSELLPEPVAASSSRGARWTNHVLFPRVAERGPFTPQPAGRRAGEPGRCSWCEGSR